MQQAALQVETAAACLLLLLLLPLLLHVPEAGKQKGIRKMDPFFSTTGCMKAFKQLV